MATTTEIVPVDTLMKAAQDRVAQGMNPPQSNIAIGNTTAVTNGNRNRLFRRSLMDLPLAKEATDAFVARMVAENRQDIDVSIRDLSMLPSGHITRGKGKMTISPEALGQMLARTTFPEASAAATYLSAIPAPRRAAEVNAILGEYAGDDSTIVLRSRNNFMPDNSIAGRGIFAAVSERYVVQDAYSVLSRFVEMLLRSGRYNPEDLRMTILSDSIRTEALVHYGKGFAGGEEHSTYFRLKTGDSGKHAHQGEFGVLRLICRNGLTVANPFFSNNLRHTGEQSSTLVDRMIRVGPEVLSTYGKQWSQAQDTRLEDFVDNIPVYPTPLAPELLVGGTYRGLLHDGRISLPGFRGEKAVDELVSAWSKEPDLTKAGVVNGITRAAHESPLLSMWSVEDVQEAAGKILASNRKVHFLDN